MAYDEAKTARLTALLTETEGRKAHSRAAATYRDAPALKETLQLVEDQLSRDREAVTLVDSIAVLAYVADRYDSLGRFAVSAAVYTQALGLALELKRQYGTDTAGVGDLYYRALLARNFYVDDDCADLAECGAALMPAGEAERMLGQRKASRRFLVHDPVEMTEQYLAVIDRVEERVEESRTAHGLGSCYEVWALRRAYLAECGVAWRSPAELNLGVRFD